MGDHHANFSCNFPMEKIYVLQMTSSFWKCLLAQSSNGLVSLFDVPRYSEQSVHGDGEDLFLSDWVTLKQGLLIILAFSQCQAKNQTENNRVVSHICASFQDAFILKSPTNP